MGCIISLEATEAVVAVGHNDGLRGIFAGDSGTERNITLPPAGKPLLPQ